MVEKNKIYLLDCIEGLKKLDDNSVDLFIFSPPYNKKGFLGKKKSYMKNEDNLWNNVIQYDNYDDDMDEEEYRQWQVDILNLCCQKLKPTGSVFYQHKIRVKENIASSPLEWIGKSTLLFRQLIVWNRMGSVNVNKSRFLPTTELIFWLTKSNKDVRFERQGAITEVWNIPADTSNSHPAPYPVKLVENMIRNVLGSKEMIAKQGHLLVVDPFMGSGTTGVAAKKLGCDFIGFDMSEKYVKEATKRIEETEVLCEKNNSIWD